MAALFSTAVWPRQASCSRPAAILSHYKYAKTLTLWVSVSYCTKPHLIPEKEWIQCSTVNGGVGVHTAQYCEWRGGSAYSAVLWMEGWECIQRSTVNGGVGVHGFGTFKSEILNGQTRVARLKIRVTELRPPVGFSISFRDWSPKYCWRWQKVVESISKTFLVFDMWKHIIIWLHLEWILLYDVYEEQSTESGI